MKISKYLLVTFLLLIQYISFAQWKELALPFGYDFNYNYFIVGNNELFIVGDGDIYYSSDLGLVWHKTGFPNFDHEMKIDKMIETINHDIYFGFKKDVWKFDKNTISWLKVTTTPFTIINVDYYGNIWYKSDDPLKNEYYLSKDGGKNYQYFEFPLLPNCPPLKISAHNDGYYYISYVCFSWEGNFFRFNDAGETKKLGVEPFLGYNNFFLNPVTSTIISRNSTNTISRSTDSGNTFKAISFSGYTPSDLFELYRMDNSDLIMDNGQSWISEDDGVTWKDINNYFPAGPVDYFNTMFSYINLSDSIVAFEQGCEDQGVYVSPDKGISWERRYDNFFSPQTRRILSDKNDNLYAITCSDTCAQVSYDKGTTWQKYCLELNGEKFGIREMSISKNGEIYVISLYGIFKSIDNGNSYIKLENIPQITQYGGVYDVVFAENGFIYILDYFGNNVISKDDGVNFTSIYLNQNVYLKIYTDDKGMLYLVNYFNLTIYDPILNTYFTVPLTPGLVFDINKDGAIYSSTYEPFYDSSYIYILTDYLQTKQQINVVPGEVKSMFFDKDKQLYAFSSKGIFLSSNGLDEFEFFASSPVSDSLDENQFYISEDQELYLFRNDPPKIYLCSKNLGQTTQLNGTVYYDSNTDCQYSLGENGIANKLININGQVNKKRISDTNGLYSAILTEGTYTINTTIPNALWKICPSNVVNITGNPNNPFTLDLGLNINELCPYLSADIQHPFMRRCNDNYTYVKYCNEGTATAFNAELTFTLHDSMLFKTSTPNPFSENGQELVYQLGDIEPGQCGSINIHSFIKCGIDLHELMCMNAKITPANICSTMLPDLSIIERCDSTTGAFDPNDKTAFINGKPSNGQTEMNQDVDYMIRFQNTGTDTAFRVLIQDKLPLGFDINTIKPLNSSHPYTLEIEDHNLKFIFDPIMLPDSNINEAASHGFVAFKVSPLKDLPYGTKLDNKADIYFDYNTAVTTNTAFLLVAKPVRTSELSDELSFNFYPNPTKGDLNIQIASTISKTYTILLTDILGKVIFKESQAGTYHQLKFDNGLLPGLYFVNVADEFGKKGYGKVVIE